MKVPGIKSCYDEVSGLFYFPRMCSKIRLHAVGELPDDYHSLLGDGFDGRTCRYLRVAYEEVKKKVLTGLSDAEVFDWCAGNGRSLTDEEKLIFNSFMSKRGWRDDETDQFIPDLIQEFSLPDDGRLLTDFDVIEMDEGRWSPDQWRDAWSQVS